MYYFIFYGLNFIKQLAELVKKLEKNCPEFRTFELCELSSRCLEILSKHQFEVHDLSTIGELIFLAFKY